MVSFMLVTAVILTVAGGCVEELDGGIEDRQEQQYLAFSTRLSDEATKAAPMTMLSGEAGIIGYVYDKWPTNADAIKTFAPWNQLQNKSFTFDGDQLAATSGMVKWSAVGNTQKSKLKIYAYAPATVPVSYKTEGSNSLYKTPDADVIFTFSDYRNNTEGIMETIEIPQPNDFYFVKKSEIYRLF